MPKTTIPIFRYFIFLFAFPACHSTPEKKTISYQSLPVQAIVDSLEIYSPGYKQDLYLWKDSYETCLHDSLFANALYLGLESKIGIGSISNRFAQNLNRQILVLDTSSKGHIFDMLSINKSANCFSKINLNKSLQNAFYKELLADLKTSGEWAYLANLIDSTQIDFKVSTLMDFSLRPDSLVSLLERTKDTSLLFFKDILTTPGNVLLLRVVMLTGFDTEFHLVRNFTAAEEDKWKTEVYFTFGEHGEKGTFKGLSNQRVRMHFEKYFTIFGQFYSFSKN